MSEQIERVAMALYIDIFPASGDWLKASAGVRELFLSQARIAVEALRPELEDAERLDWIQNLVLEGDYSVHISPGHDQVACKVVFVSVTNHDRNKPLRKHFARTIREAADAARQEGNDGN
jgi:hypothetical protein